MSSDVPSPNPGDLNPPLQPRSRRSLQRILAAAEALLAERAFEDIRVEEIAEHAGLSTGAFYARFKGKEALLSFMIGHYQEAENARLGRFLASDEARGLTLEARIGYLGDLVRRDAKKHRGVLRALVSRSMLSAETLDKDIIRRARETRDLLTAWISECGDEIGHPAPGAAAQFAIYMIISIGQSALLFGPPATAKIAGFMIAQAERAALAYLRSGARNGRNME